MAKEKMIGVGITHGDINGIGYEVIMKTFADERMMELCTPVIFGSTKLIAYNKKTVSIEDFNYVQAHTLDDIKDGVCNLVNISDEEFAVEPGQSTAASGRAAFMSLQQAVDAMKAGYVDVLVTAPINKNAIHSKEFDFPGHTEYLESVYGNGHKAMMLMFNDELKIALVTTHLPLSQVPAMITKELIVDTVKNLYTTLRKDFAIECPKIAMLSLNPHAGEDGLLGEEEQTIIKPAIDECNERKMFTFGPFAADGFFGTQGYKKYDAVVAMYHDQGLVPFKNIAMQTGVNFTAGLPYIRTSPDHGTGYDIVGKDMADETSMRCAVYKAIDLYRNRMNYIHSHSNPLKKQYVDRSGDKVVLDLTKDDEITD